MDSIVFCLITAVAVLLCSGVHVGEGVEYRVNDGLFRSHLVPDDYKTGDVDSILNHNDNFFKPPYVYKRDYGNVGSGFDRHLRRKLSVDVFETSKNTAGFSRLYPELIDVPQLGALAVWL